MGAAPPAVGEAAGPAGVTAALSAVPRQLPGATRHFVGRARELADLARMLDGACAEGGVDGQAGAIVISAIGGTAGVGKTALAVHWAHQVAGRFPDGQLYANLRGFDPAGPPARPSEVILGFLAALGVPPERAPADLDAQAALYRSLLAARQVLVLLDNARDSAQVRPLLPGSSGCLVVVTSRAELTSLVAAEGAHLLALDVLGDGEARALLVECIGRLRAAADPAAVAELAGLCAGLPLALRVVAARAAARPGLPLAALASELGDAGGRLNALSAGEPGTDVRTVFSWSYQRLGSAAARMFRLLGIASGPDITASAAASLAGISQDQAGRALSELSGAYLVTERLPGRYVCHDLMRAYAAELAEAEEPAAERTRATRRLLSWYLHTMDAADRILMPSRRHVSLDTLPPGCQPPAFANYTQALAWCDAERPNLLAAVHFAAEHAQPEIAWKLLVASHSYYDLRSPGDAYITAGAAALSAARRDGSPLAEGCVLTALSSAHHRNRRFSESLDCARRSVGVCRQSGDRLGEVTALNNIAAVYADTGHPERALEIFRQVADGAAAIGDNYAERVALQNLGEVLCWLHRPREATGYLTRALQMARDCGDPVCEGDTLAILGSACRALDQPENARVSYERAVGVFRDAGDLRSEAQTRCELADLLHDSGDVAAARRYWEAALAVFEKLGDPKAAEIRRLLASQGSS
jgi:tetratricopeptide (TPR) repeat protein